MLLYSYCYNKTDVCGLIEEFVDKNEEYMAAMVDSNANNSYWYQVLRPHSLISGLLLHPRPKYS